jgi:RNA polymerase sigma-70 factor (ECF subfamily)
MTILQTEAHSTASRFHKIAVSRAPAQSDDFILERIAEGDQNALKMLVARYEVRVFRFILRLMGDRRRAEDLVSDTFLAVWQRAGTFEGRSSVATWILAIARYKALTARSQLSPQEEPFTSELAEALVDGGPRPDDNLARLDRSATIRRCLNALPKHHAELMDLVYYHEKSIQEVALIVGIPENTVKSRMFLARRKLAELLIAEGVDRA